jgi:DNA-binding NtrC family response regulator
MSGARKERERGGTHSAHDLRTPGSGGRAGVGGTRTLTPPPSLSDFGMRAACSNCTLLVTGETGVGKGHLAKWMHAVSPRGEGPFIPVNCGAIPESIVDSQLFGHVRGAFSGATSDHLGLVRAAEHGTLFLDEVGELPPSAQTRLLRLLQDHEVQPVGHSRPIVIDVRIIAATNGDLRDAVRRKTFREDLLFRLDVIRINVKPLHERLGELDRLLEEFNREFAELYRREPLRFEADAMRMLRGYRWPGNIRQLRTVVERLHVLCPDERVTPERLVEIGHGGDATSGAEAPAYSGVSMRETPGGRSFEDVKYDEVRQVLEANGGSVARAAAVFGVHRSTIYRWLKGRGGDHE